MNACEIAAVTACRAASNAESALVFGLHIVFMDLVPNWASGYLLHRVPWLREHQHKAEHALTRRGELWTIFMRSALYGLYTLAWMYAWGFAVACTHGRDNCFHWESAMWIASFAYTAVGLVLRLLEELLVDLPPEPEP